MTLEQMDIFRMEVARQAFDSYNFSHPNVIYNEKVMETWEKKGNTYSITLPLNEQTKNGNIEEDNVILYVDFKDNDFRLDNEEGGVHAYSEKKGNRIGKICDDFYENIEAFYNKLDAQYLEEVAKEVVVEPKERFNIKF